MVRNKTKCCAFVHFGKTNQMHFRLLEMLGNKLAKSCPLLLLRLNEMTSSRVCRAVNISMRPTLYAIISE